MIEFLTAGVGVVLAILIVATVFTVGEYTKQLRKAKKEYEKAKESVEDIVLSFNRELKREAGKLETVSYRLENVASKADAGIKSAEIIENRVAPIENEVLIMTRQVENFNTIVNSISANNEKTLELVSNLDLNSKFNELRTSQEGMVEVGAKIQSIEQGHAELKTKISYLEDQLKKLPIPLEIGSEPIASPSILPVLPLRREKALGALTETEISVLEFLANEGPKTAPEIKEKVQLSREHTARLMKKLYEEGYLERETGKLPFKYSVKKEMESLLRKQVTPSA